MSVDIELLTGFVDILCEMNESALLVKRLSDDVGETGGEGVVVDDDVVVSLMSDLESLLVSA